MSAKILTSDAAWMRRALSLARRGWGQTSPNPMVGALVVKNGRLIGAGYHHRAGTPHAEIHALNQAGRAARKGTLFVTLEPCSTWGRTPPCTDAIISAGIKRVVIGCLDPNPKHQGRGIALLRKAGITVSSGVGEEVCRQLNEAFFTWIRKRRPFVLLKLAMTLDGKIATTSGESKWITGKPARCRVQKSRQWADAILIGGETVRQDDPALTVRTPQNWWRQPLKLVWSSRRDFPAELKIFAESAKPPEFIHPVTRAEWDIFLQNLGARDIISLLIEGGGELAGACLRAGMIDKIEFYYAPKILGGRNSRPGIGGPNPRQMTEAVPLRQMRVRKIGDDFLVTGYLNDVYRID